MDDPKEGIQRRLRGGDVAPDERVEVVVERADSTGPLANAEERVGAWQGCG